MTLKGIQFAVIGALALTLAWGFFQKARADRAYIEEAERSASLALELATESARADGWETQYGEAIDGLNYVLLRDSSMISDLAEQLTAARARVISLTALTASASNVIVDTVEVVRETAAGLEWAGSINDGILTADWLFQPPVLTLPYTCTIPGQLVQALGLAGEVVVFAKPFDPRASFAIDTLFVDMPPPRSARRASPLLTGGVGVLGYILGRIF